jgi:hypothetical protein|tara:strand:- start:2355 stop:2498 length:144 start_codon:yes stop_codon:yes gene_type:complete
MALSIKDLDHSDVKGIREYGPVDCVPNGRVEYLKLFLTRGKTGITTS